MTEETGSSQPTSISEKAWIDSRLSTYNNPCTKKDRADGGDCVRPSGHAGYCWSEDWYRANRNRIVWWEESNE